MADVRHVPEQARRVQMADDQQARERPLARPDARGPERMPFLQPGAVEVEQLHPVVLAVADRQGAFVHKAQCVRDRELPRPGSRLAPRLHVTARRVEVVDPGIAVAVGDENVPRHRVHGDVRRLRERVTAEPGRPALLPEDTHELAVHIALLDAVRAGVDQKHGVVADVDDTVGARELAHSPARQVVARLVEDDDRRRATAIEHQDAIVIGHRDRVGRAAEGQFVRDAEVISYRCERGAHPPLRSHCLRVTGVARPATGHCRYPRDDPALSLLPTKSRDSASTGWASVAGRTCSTRRNRSRTRRRNETIPPGMTKMTTIRIAP